MSLLIEHINNLKEHWAIQVFDEEFHENAFLKAKQLLVQESLSETIKLSKGDATDFGPIEQLATAYEIAALEGLDSIIHPSNNKESIYLQSQAEAGAYQAFELRRVIPLGLNNDKRIFDILHLSGLAYCSDRWTDLRRWFTTNPSHFEIPSLDNASWEKRLLYKIFDAWILLLRKNSWEDLEKISQIIVDLRKEQAIYETEYLEKSTNTKSSYLQLVALYHWAKATEILSMYMLQGEPIAIATELDQHYEQALEAVKIAQDYQFEMILRWLYVASKKMSSNSVWWVAHTVNSRVTKFVNHTTKSKALFELLPPQKAALKEQGLLDQANRAVVVDMPTSGGKTALAQFRILQALNQFDQDDGWVAYIAPTRALVSQITRRLKEDFSPLGIHVEKLSGAIEVDAFEETLLEEENSFQVLVATPEKLQLVIRNKKITRPLALAVMDEAHNIEDESRGLRIELLLATIKQEAQKANFLLLMPYVPNASDLANWLAPGANQTISMGSTAWAPNERIIGIFDSEKYEGKGSKKGDWKLNFETLTTTQRSIHLKGVHNVGSTRPIKNVSASQANGVNIQAGAMAKTFSAIGTSVAVAGTIPQAWSTARKLYKDMETLKEIPDDIALVQRFLATEVSDDFELIDMLSKGIALHHAGLPSEVLSLIEWLIEKDHIKVLCATTTIAQGLNFPVSSVFLSTYKYPYGKLMPARAFWNLAGRAGRVQHDSIGVVGIAAGKNPNDVRKYVCEATNDLISRLVNMLDDLESSGELNNLATVIQHEQWDDFRSYIAHLWNEKRDLELVINEAEQLLRQTYGYSTLRSNNDELSKRKADVVLEATKSYVRTLADHNENAALADSTGFSPEGVRTALLELNSLERKLTPEDWKPHSLFGDTGSSILPELVGVMMKVPQIKKGLEDLNGKGASSTNIADISRAWVSGESIKEIANLYFTDDDPTEAISKACRAVYRDLSNNSAWGLSALSKMPTSGLDFENLSDEEKRTINNLPAMLYHGVNSEEAVLMRMNSVPRSIADNLAIRFRKDTDALLSPKKANDFLKSLKTEDWNQIKPHKATLSGDDYQKIWKTLSGDHS